MVASMKEMRAVEAKFAAFDLDGSGFIDQIELCSILKAINPDNMTEETVAKMFKELDENGDGQVSVKEFIAWVFGGSADVCALIDEDFKSKLATLQEKIAAFDELPAGTKFWISVDTKNFAKPKDFHGTREEWAAEVAKKPKGVSHCELKKRISLDEFFNQHREYYEKILSGDDYADHAKKVAAGQHAAYKQGKDPDYVDKLQKKDYADYIAKFNEDLAAAGEFALDSQFPHKSILTCAENLLTFVTKGGPVPPSLEGVLLDRRSLVASWKGHAKKLIGGYLMTKTRPGMGEMREAAYELVDVHKNGGTAFVIPLSGCKYRPEIVATSDGKGGFELPMNESQKKFDVLKPTQVLACEADFANQIDKFLQLIAYPVEEGAPSPAHLADLPFVEPFVQVVQEVKTVNHAQAPVRKGRRG